jgi:hypothetical protein
VINIRDFRIALSRAIDRKRINKKCALANRDVMMTVTTEHDGFKHEYETKYGSMTRPGQKKKLDRLEHCGPQRRRLAEDPGPNGSPST